MYYKLQTFIYLSANGIIQGIRPLVGYNYGAGEHKRVDKIFRTAMKLTVSIMILGTILAWVIPYQLIGLFTANPETIKIGVNMKKFIRENIFTNIYSWILFIFTHGMKHIIDDI